MIQKKNKKKYYKNIRERNRNFFNIIKQYNNCFLCGDKRHYVLDFHHLSSSEKDFSISRAGGNTYSLKYLLKEIEKCACLCSNCHREVHFLNKKDIILDTVKIPQGIIENLRKDKSKNIGKSGFLGVSIKEKRKQYYVSFNRKNFRHFKSFLIKEEAAKYYDDIITQLDGLQAITNKKLGLI